MIDDHASIFMSDLEMCVCVYMLYESTLCGQLAERDQDGHRCYYCLRVSPFLTDSHKVAQLESAYYPMTRAYSTHTDTRFTVMVRTFHLFLLFSYLHKIIIILTNCYIVPLSNHFT